MTPAEYDAIGALHKSVEDGFREMRGLMETRRVEDVQTVAGIESRLRRVEQVAFTTRVIAGGGMVVFGTLFGGLLYAFR